MRCLETSFRGADKPLCEQRRRRNSISERLLWANCAPLGPITTSRRSSRMFSAAYTETRSCNCCCNCCCGMKPMERFLIRLLLHSSGIVAPPSSRSWFVDCDFFHYFVFNAVEEMFHLVHPGEETSMNQLGFLFVFSLLNIQNSLRHVVGVILRSTESVSQTIKWWWET